MDMIKEAIVEWLKELLSSGIISNLSGMFDTVNEGVGGVAAQVGSTPQAWNSSIFNMIQNLSNSVILEQVNIKAICIIAAPAHSVMVVLLIGSGFIVTGKG